MWRVLAASVFGLLWGTTTVYAGSIVTVNWAQDINVSVCTPAVDRDWGRRPYAECFRTASSLISTPKPGRTGGMR